MHDPLVSVIIPTYNRAAYIAEAIASVLAQSYGRVELLVVDDGSTDETPELVRGRFPEARYLRQDNRGFAAARNAGVVAAKADFLAFLDSDDVWLADKLVRQMAVLRAAAGTEAVYGHAEQFVSPELDAAEAMRFRHIAGKVQESPTACALLIRRPAFDRVGPFDESLRVGVEMDWYARLCDAGLSVVTLAEPVYRRRLHRSNLNLTHADEQSERLRVLKKTLDRRRNRVATEG